MASLAIFDFDGTITHKDSLPHFIKYAVGKPAYYVGLIRLSPMLMAYLFKLIANDVAKAKLLAYFFKGWQASHFQTIADSYASKELDKIVRAKAIEKITWHQDEGHTVVIVSASIESWLQTWCEKRNLALIATRLAIKEGKLTGALAGQNCYGIEKVNRLKARYNLADYSAIYAYGDSAGDKAMLALATQPYYKRFN